MWARIFIGAEARQSGCVVGVNGSRREGWLDCEEVWARAPKPTGEAPVLPEVGIGSANYPTAMMRGQKKPVAVGSKPAGAGVFHGVGCFEGFVFLNHSHFVSQSYESDYSELPYSIHR
jgi:hypothetical protein